MPVSKGRKEAEFKKKQRERERLADQRDEKQRTTAPPGTRRWVAPAFITAGLLGVAWLVVYYVASQYIPFMAALGVWNLAIGMGLMALAFVLATFWK